MHNIWQGCIEVASAHEEQTPGTNPPSGTWFLVSSLICSEAMWLVCCGVSETFAEMSHGVLSRQQLLWELEPFGESTMWQSPGSHLKWSSYTEEMAKHLGKAPNTPWTEHPPNLWGTQSKGASPLDLIRFHQSWPPSFMHASASSRSGTWSRPCHHFLKSHRISICCGAAPGKQPSWQLNRSWTLW